MSILSENIITLRKHLGLSGEKFAKKFGVQLSAYQTYEGGRVKNPAPLFIANLTEHFGISAGQIFKERITPEQLKQKAKPSDYSMVHVKLEAALEMIEQLKNTIADKDEIIRLLKAKK